MRRLVHRKKDRHAEKKSRAQPLLTLTKGDTVEIITGNDKGKRGRILRVYPRTGRVMVEGVNVVKRHTKPTQTSEGGIIEKVMPIHHSNAMLIDPKTGEPTRIRRQRDKEGTVERIAVKSGQPIPRTR